MARVEHKAQKKRLGGLRLHGVRRGLSASVEWAQARQLGHQGPDQPQYVDLQDRPPRCWRKGYFTHMRELWAGCQLHWLLPRRGARRAHSQRTSCKLTVSTHGARIPFASDCHRSAEPQPSLRPTCSLARGSGQPQQTSPQSQLLSEVRAGVRTRPRRHPPTITARAADNDLRTLLGKRLCSLGPCTPKERLATPSTRARASGHGL